MPRTSSPKCSKDRISKKQKSKKVHSATHRGRRRLKGGRLQAAALTTLTSGLTSSADEIQTQLALLLEDMVAPARGTATSTFASLQQVDYPGSDLILFHVSPGPNKKGRPRKPVEIYMHRPTLAHYCITFAAPAKTKLPEPYQLQLPVTAHAFETVCLALLDEDISQRVEDHKAYVEYILTIDLLDIPSLRAPAMADFSAYLKQNPITESSLDVVEHAFLMAYKVREPWRSQILLEMVVRGATKTYWDVENPTRQRKRARGIDAVEMCHAAMPGEMAKACLKGMVRRELELLDRVRRDGEGGSAT